MKLQNVRLSIPFRGTKLTPSTPELTNLKSMEMNDWKTNNEWVLRKIWWKRIKEISQSNNWQVETKSLPILLLSFLPISAFGFFLILVMSSIIYYLKSPGKFPPEMNWFNIIVVIKIIGRAQTMLILIFKVFVLI